MTLLYSGVCTECFKSFACEWVQGEGWRDTCSVLCRQAREERLECDSEGLGYLTSSKGSRAMPASQAAATCVECGVEFALKRSGRRNKTCSRECSQARNRAMMRLKRANKSEAVKKTPSTLESDASYGGSEPSEGAAPKASAEKEITVETRSRQRVPRTASLPRGRRQSDDTAPGSRSTLRGPLQGLDQARPSFSGDGLDDAKHSLMKKRGRHCDCIRCITYAEMESDERAQKKVSRDNIGCLFETGPAQRARNGIAWGQEVALQVDLSMCEECGKALRDGSRRGRENERFCSDRCQSARAKAEGARSGPRSSPQSRAKRYVHQGRKNEIGRGPINDEGDEMPLQVPPADVSSSEGEPERGGDAGRSPPVLASGGILDRLTSVGRSFPSPSNQSSGVLVHDNPMEWIRTECERLKSLHRDLQRAAIANKAEYTERVEELRKERDAYKALAESGEKYKSLYYAQRVVTEGQRRLIQELTHDMP